MTAGARRSAAEQAQLDAALIELFEHRIRFNEVLGLKIDSVQPGNVRARIEMRPELVGHYSFGRLHGGVTSAVLDAVGGLALMVGIAERHPQDSMLQVMQRFSRLGTIDLRVDFLQQGRGAHFIAGRRGHAPGQPHRQHADAADQRRRPARRHRRGGLRRGVGRAAGNHGRRPGPKPLPIGLTSPQSAPSHFDRIVSSDLRGPAAPLEVEITFIA